MSTKTTPKAAPTRIQENFESEAVRQLPANESAAFKYFDVHAGSAVAIQELGSKYAPSISGKALTSSGNSHFSITLHNAVSYAASSGYVSANTRATVEFVDAGGTRVHSVTGEGGSDGKFLDLGVPIGIAEIKSVKVQTYGDGFFALDNISLSEA